MRSSNTFYTGYGNVYPGEYEPIPGKETELKHELHKKGAKVLKPDLSMKDMPEYYKIEMPAPGFNREDFFVHTNGFKLSVGALNKTHPGGSHELHHHQHHFNCGCINREIPLPTDVDTDFVTAEYANGILNIFLFKSSRPSDNRAGDIIVY